MWNTDGTKKECEVFTAWSQTHLVALVVFFSTEVNTFSFESSLSIPDSSRRAGPTAALRKEKYNERVSEKFDRT